MSAWRKWVALLSRTEPGTALALTRIGAGLCVVVPMVTVVMAGQVPFLWFDVADGGYRALEGGPWLVALLGGPTPSTVWSLIVVTLLAGGAVTVGVASRPAAFLALQGFNAVSSINGHAGGADDMLLTNLLWLLVLTDAGATLSLSCRLRTGRWTSDRPVGTWVRYLVIFQLVVLYASSGSQKVSSYWVPGGDFSALYYILQQPTWQRFDMSWLATWFPLTQVGTALTWWWEVSAPLLLLALWYSETRARSGRIRAFFNRVHWRTVFAGYGVTMHLLIFVLMKVGPFSWVAISFYPCLFQPDEWRLVGARLTRWARAEDGVNASAKMNHSDTRA